VLNGGEVVKAFLYQETDDPVGVEDEVASLGILIANDPTGILDSMHQLGQIGELLTRAAQ
jgi:hypothetical protein